MKRRVSLRRAFALMTVLWAIGIMTIFVGGLVGYVRLQAREATARDKDAIARDIALSGLALGLHPTVRRNDPLLSEKIGPDRSCEVTIDGENGRLNLNAVLLSGRVDILQRLWIGWGLSLDQAQALDDSLADWISPGDLRRANGAKRDRYARLGHPELPPGRPFQILDELPMVIGFSAVEKLKPDWRDCLTLWSNGRLDVNEAPADLIAAVCNVGLPRAQALVQNRDPNGRKDDPGGHRFESVEETIAFLGMAEIDKGQAIPFLDVDSTAWRVRSVGTVGRHRHTVIVVSERAHGNSGYYLWEEL